MEPCESYLDTYEGSNKGSAPWVVVMFIIFPVVETKHETLAAQRRKGVFQLLILEVSVYSLWPHGCWA